MTPKDLKDCIKAQAEIINDLTNQLHELRIYIKSCKNCIKKDQEIAEFKKLLNGSI